MIFPEQRNTKKSIPEQLQSPEGLQSFKEHFKNSFLDLVAKQKPIETVKSFFQGKVDAFKIDVPSWISDNLADPSKLTKLGKEKFGKYIEGNFDGVWKEIHEKLSFFGDKLQYMQHMVGAQLFSIAHNIAPESTEKVVSDITLREYDEKLPEYKHMKDLLTAIFQTYAGSDNKDQLIDLYKSLSSYEFQQGKKVPIEDIQITQGFAIDVLYKLVENKADMKSIFSILTKDYASPGNELRVVSQMKDILNVETLTGQIERIYDMFYIKDLNKIKMDEIINKMPPQSFTEPQRVAFMKIADNYSAYLGKRFSNIDFQSFLSVFQNITRGTIQFGTLETCLHSIKSKDLKALSMNSLSNNKPLSLQDILPKKSSEYKDIEEWLGKESQ